MLEVIIQGRGGQGAQLAGNLLAMAFFAEGKQVQSFATYGGARRGTPVSSFIRIADAPIRLRCDIEHPNAILCFDASLLEGRLLASATHDTLIVVNSAKSADDYQHLGQYRVVPIDGIAISQKHGLGRIVNSALLGAFVCGLKAPGMETLTRIIGDAAPAKKVENVSACREGYQRAQELFGDGGGR